MMKINFFPLKYTLVIILFFLVSCLNKFPMSHKKIHWVKILNTEANVDFFQIDKELAADSKYIMSYSYPFSIGGGFKILRLNIGKDSSQPEIILGEENKGLSFVNILKDSIGIIQNDIKDNSVHTTLLLSYDKGKNWIEKNTPITRLRRFYRLDSILIIEGYLEGTGQVFKSNSFGDNWERVNKSEKYKSFRLTNDAVSGNRLFCIASRDFNYKDNQLLLFNINNDSTEDILDIQTVNSFVRVISGETQYAIIKDNCIKLYSYINNKMEMQNKFCLPFKIASIENLFVADDLYILTAQNDEGDVLSWISYEKGSNWVEFNHQKRYKLIFNQDGYLFMIDSDNNVFKGDIIKSETNTNSVLRRVPVKQ